ncbi:MAG: hypothetical protein L0G82_17370 [Pseudomonas sp.]|nr:hypothetical protein [Pseudomonas sp.]
MTDQNELQREIDRLKGTIMGVDCFISALLKVLPPESTVRLERWFEVEAEQLKIEMNASPDFSDDAIAGLDEFAMTWRKVRESRRP